MDKVLPFYKLVGLTPLQAINNFRQIYPQYNSQKISCAGKLDPLAEGLLLLLIGKENKNRNHYEKLDKTYTLEILFGIATDTYDALGLITASSRVTPSSLNHSQLTKTLNSFKGKQIQAYPPFSAVRVKSKPLFYWARTNQLQKVDIPNHHIQIYTVALEEYTTINTETVRNTILEKIGKVSGDFRQEEIIQRWEDFFASTTFKQIPLLKATINCSSGTYVRQLVTDIGRKLKIPTLTYSITRTKIGDFSLQNTLKL